MDNLRWTLLLIGVAIIGVIYAVSRWREKASRGERRPRKLNEDNDTPIESFSANEDEPAPAGWPGSPTEHLAHDTHDVKMNWDAAMDDPAPVLADEPPAAAHEAETPTQTTEIPAADIEPLVLVLAVMAPDGQPMKGADIRTALEAEGLHHGDMNIFHFHRAGEKDAVFSVANAVEPGVFDLAAMAELETPGITLFCQLPGPLANDAAFDLMLDKARAIAARLDGHVCDDRRNALTPQAIAHYHDRIETFGRELALARKKSAER